MRVAVLYSGLLGGGGQVSDLRLPEKANLSARSKAALKQSAEDRLLIPHIERSFLFEYEALVVHFG